MRLIHLLHLATIVLVTVAAPLTSTPTEQFDNDIAISDDRGPPPLSTLEDDNEYYHVPPDRRTAIRPEKSTNRYNPIAKPPSDIPETDSNRLQPAAGRTTDSSNTFDLAPLVQKFNMAHNLPMASKGDAVREISSESIKDANIPRDLRLTEGSFVAAGLPKSLYKVTDAKRFQSAGVDLVGARLKAERIRANPQYGELALQSIMAASLFDPANGVLSAITGSDSSVFWRAIGSGFPDPVPDVLLTAGGQNAAVIEIKTTTAFPKFKFKEVMDSYSTYTMKPRIENKTEVYRLFQPKIANPKTAKTTATKPNSEPKRKTTAIDLTKRTLPSTEEKTEEFDRKPSTRSMEQVSLEGSHVGSKN